MRTAVVKNLAAAAGMLIAAAGAAPAAAQLRIVSYNTANAQIQSASARPGMDIVLQAIGQEQVGGIAKPVDVLLLQEQFNPFLSTQSFVDVMNGIYGEIYARGVLDSATFGAGKPGIVFNTHTVELIEEFVFGELESGGQQRPTYRYRLRPVGYDASADFFVYVDHYKAEAGAANENARQIEAQSVRADADALGQGAHVIYAGDFNIQGSSEAMYQTLLAEGPGQAIDPIDTPGFWHNNTVLRRTHTQAPSASSAFGLTGGGVDDRFDFQLVSGELLDGEGLDYIEGSYRAFGNNGTHSCCNSSITTGDGAAEAVLEALETVSDHLPVVADYQVPAVMSVDVAVVPVTIELDALATIDVTISNLADVVASSGGDELDFLLDTTGDLLGSSAGTILPLESGDQVPVTLDASSLGAKSGEIIVRSDSPGAANSLVVIPISYTVADGFAAADFDQSGQVDAEDLVRWRLGFGRAGDAEKADGDANADGNVDGQDVVVWQRQYQVVGAAASGQLSAPEPPGLALATLLIALTASARMTSHRGNMQSTQNAKKSSTV